MMALKRAVNLNPQSVRKNNVPPKRKSTEGNSEAPSMTRRAQAAHARLQPNNLLAKANEHYHIQLGPGKAAYEVQNEKDGCYLRRTEKHVKTDWYCCYAVSLFVGCRSSSCT
ncbi:hypothetical protein COOONC_23456 [Cooperia oncophora]